MTAPRTTVRCPDKRFRTRRYAKRWAWGLEPDPSKRRVRCSVRTAQPGTWPHPTAAPPDQHENRQFQFCDLG